MTFMTFTFRLIRAIGDVAVLRCANFAVLDRLRGDAFDFIVNGHLVGPHTVGTADPQHIVSGVHPAPVR